MLIIAMLAIPTMAQDNNTRTIHVTGSGTAYGSPDTAYVEVGVDMLDKDFAVAFNSTSKAVDTVLAAMKELGIKAEDIQTTSINVWWEDEYDRDGNSTGVRKYHVSQSMQIVVRDINQIESVITTAVENGANQIYGLNFGMSETTELEADARSQAVADGRARAENLAQLLGVEWGDPISITELNNGANPINTGGGGGGIAYDKVQSMAVSPGQLSVNVSVDIVYAMK